VSGGRTASSGTGGCGCPAGRRPCPRARCRRRGSPDSRAGGRSRPGARRARSTRRGGLQRRAAQDLVTGDVGREERVVVGQRHRNVHLDPGRAVGRDGQLGLIALASKDGTGRLDGIARGGRHDDRAGEYQQDDADHMAHAVPDTSTVPRGRQLAYLPSCPCSRSRPVRPRARLWPEPRTGSPFRSPRSRWRVRPWAQRSRLAGGFAQGFEHGGPLRRIGREAHRRRVFVTHELDEGVEQVLPIGRHRSTPDTSAGRQEKEARRPHADRGAVPIREVAHRKTTEVTCPCSGLVEVPNGRFQQT